MITCMFTGHRPQNLSFRFNEDDYRCQELKRRLAILIREKIENGVTCFLSGMAIGVDCYAAEIVLSLKGNFRIYPYMLLFLAPINLVNGTINK